MENIIKEHLLFTVARAEKTKIKKKVIGAVVVAQLVEQLLPIPEVRSSNPVIGNKLY